MSGLFGMSWGTIASVATTLAVGVATGGVGLIAAPLVGGVVGGLVDGVTTGDWVGAAESAGINAVTGLAGAGVGALGIRALGAGFARLAGGMAGRIGNAARGVAGNIAGDMWTLGTTTLERGVGKVTAAVAEGISNTVSQTVSSLPVIDIGNGAVRYKSP